MDQILNFALAKVQEYSDSPDLHHPTTIQNILSLLLAPISSYLTCLTLLALPSYSILLLAQPYATRKAIGNAIVASVLKNEITIETPEDVQGLLDLCHVLVRDQRDKTVPSSALGSGMRSMSGGVTSNGRGQQPYDVEEMGEEQGWIARMVHLFRAEDLEVQFKVSLVIQLSYDRLLMRVRSYYKQHGKNSQKEEIEFDGLSQLSSSPLSN